MNKVNPLFLLIGSIFITFLSVYLLEKSKDKLAISNKELLETKVLAANYANLSNQYRNIDKIIMTLEEMAKKAKINNINIIREDKKIILKVSNSNKSTIDRLANKIFNSNFNITKLELDEKTFSIEIGVL